MNTVAIHHEPELTISLEIPSKRWLLVNERKWGFFTDKRTIYCHRRKPEQFRRELGFHIPRVLLNYVVSFEVKNATGYTVWTYDPKNKQRMFPTLPMIFIALSRLTWDKDAVHVPRAR